MTQKQKVYFLQQIYNSEYCEFEQNNIKDNTNHIIMSCSTNKQIRQDMYEQLQIQVNEQLKKIKTNKQNKSINIKEQMCIKHTDDENIKMQKRMIGRGLITNNLKNKIQKTVTKL